jgi:hypothetical protein
MIFRKFPYSTDWHQSNKILDESIDFIESKFKIDRSHDVPYVAGYSKDGKIIFIDKDMPESFKSKAGKVIKTDKYLILHEAIEITLIERFGEIYQLAHQIALRVERDAVESAGISWKEYNDFMMKYVKEIGDMKKYPNVPKNLDLKPYEDEKDYKTLKDMFTESYEPLLIKMV